MLVSPQVTIVTSHMEAVGAESGDVRCRGDMEKADMVDGEWISCVPAALEMM